MSLRLSDFGKWLQGGDKIDFLETRIGEQYVIPFTIKDNQTPPVAVNITGWTFDVTSEIMTANFTYDGAGELSSISDITKQISPRTVSGLQVVNIVEASGSGILKVPASATPTPSTLVTPDANNTLLNVITITATYPSSVTGFDNVRKLMMGLIVRYGNK
jgi:hypothetical protein